MPDGTGLAQAVVEKVSDRVKDQTNSVFQEVRSELGLASSSKTQANQTNPTNPQDPQYQQLQALDEQNKNTEMAQIRQKLKMEMHQKAQMLGVSQPQTVQQKEEQEKQLEEQEREQRQKEKEKRFESISLPGSKNGQTDLGVTQSQLKGETGRGTKG
jgi:DNA-binding transcriptional regulator YiaG